METKVKCPHCSKEFSVEEVIAGDIEKHIREKYLAALQKEKDAFAEKERSLQQQRQQLEKLKEEQEKKVKEAVELEKQKLKKAAEEKAKEEAEEVMKALREENEQKSQKLREAQKKELELLKKEREFIEKQEALDLEMQKKLNELEKGIAEKVKKAEAERIELRIREYEKKLEDQKKLIDEMQRKAEQGSMQLQGEVQELAIEEWLKTSFPLDDIGEIKKGARGADCLQVVNTRTRQRCGSIYYESKRTKDFQNTWIEKFKTDMREKGATFGVLVTDVRPKDMDRMGQKDNIWICTYEEFKGLCFVLRDSVVLLSDVQSAQDNKGDKMTLLYNYLTGPEFRNQVEAIVEGFVQMRSDLDSERRAMESIWKKREKQIDKVISNTSLMYGSVKGIAGNSIGNINALELPEA